jgi:hypothetical protein
MNREAPPGVPSGYLFFYLTRLWAATRGSQPEMSDEGVAERDGQRVHIYRVTYAEPIEIYQGHALKTFVVETDDERGVPLRYTAQEPDGNLAVEAQFGDFREVAPGHWEALRIEERWEPGLIKWVTNKVVRRPDGTERIEVDHWTETAVPPAKEIIEMAVVADGVVVPKRIRRYDDRDRLLMQAEFLNYEIEYDDGTVVYAEPE